ncbi:NAD(P)/FAD-dependent oxidoreductase [Salinicola rhizosphaerae]|uniref:Oxidoreductase n=1 Tax=Salinicola rhizosphaerae TaxID=1443141 RepID=A0ABQ3DV10_9GAMM|nr:FAD-binding oxidoreductase [Salinicola rhizosphaerae]GHB11001.1 oxidoreductase [Salinicola rhizosphaerae]
MPHTIPDSYYLASRNVTLDATDPLRDEQTADVCVIGGGVTGCSAALHLAERGYRVTLLEAGEIAHGASGRSGGQILPGFGTEMPVIESALGLDDARRLWAMSCESVRLTRALITRHDIDCDLRQGYVHTAVKPRHVSAMQRHAEMMAARYDYHGEQWLDRDALRSHVRTDQYLGGLYDAEGGHLHPLNYTLGLARAAQRAGSVLHTQTPVLRVEPGVRPRVVTAQGSVRCEFVVVACNAYLDGLLPALSGRVMKVANYIIATEPLSESVASAILPSNPAVSDANFVLDYYRLSADRRLLYGGEVSYTGREPRKLDARMRDKMQTLFPVLHGVEIDYRWGGDVGITLNRAPDFGRVGDNILYAQGYSGHGMSLAGLAGQLLAEAVAGQAERFDAFAALDHRRFPGGERLRIPLLALATTFYRLRDKL